MRDAHAPRKHPPPPPPVGWSHPRQVGHAQPAAPLPYPCHAMLGSLRRLRGAERGAPSWAGAQLPAYPAAHPAPAGPPLPSQQPWGLLEAMLRRGSAGQAAGASPAVLTAPAVCPCPCCRMKAAAAVLLALVCCAQCASASRLFMDRDEFRAEQTGRRGLMAAGGESVAAGPLLLLPRPSHCRCHTLGSSNSAEWACPGWPP